MNHVTPDLDDREMSFFKEEGARKLLMYMFKQSLQDLADHVGKPPPQDPGLRASMNWPASADGRECLSLLIPGAHPQRVVEKIYADPAAVLRAVESVELQALMDDLEGAQDNVDSDAEDLVALSSHTP
ncbi:MAG: hypothetical protein V4731_03965 [Pseudomonadota bacterium]